MKKHTQSQPPKPPAKTSRDALAGVTRREQVEKSQVLNETLAALFQFAPDATLLVDADGCIARANERSEAMSGYSQEELAGKKIEILMPARFGQCLAQHRAHYVQDPHRREMGAGLELSVRRKDGTEFPVDIMLSPVESSGERCVIVTVRDITARRSMEQNLAKAHAELELRVQERTAELVQANEKLRAEVELKTAIVDVQREISRQDQCVMTSLSMIARRTQELTRASGVSIDLIEKDELVSRIATGISTENVPVWLGLASQLILECNRNGGFFRCDDTEVDQHLDRVACQRVGLRSVVMVTLYRHGPAAGVLKVVSNQPHAFGEHAVSVAQLMAGLIGSPLIRDAHDKSEKLASFAVLAAGVAHEIRNPLTAIKARLYTQQKRLVKGSPEAGDSRFVDEEIDRLERIVREFLQFARPADPVLAPVSPAELLDEVSELLSAGCRKSAIRLTISAAVKTPVLADRLQIKQVLINLVRNAAESIGRDGSITLCARQTRVGFGAMQPWEAVTLEVKDTGRGIPPEVQARLFDPFFTTKPSGTGLGLAIAWRIVEKHGGTLRFETSGKGTAFRIVLPVAKTE